MAIAVLRVVVLCGGSVREMLFWGAAFGGATARRFDWARVPALNICAVFGVDG